MSHLEIIMELHPLIGKQIIECAKDIEIIACHHGFYVNVMDPEFNTAAIDNDPKRLNVRTDKDSKVVSFTIG
jgi:hypothetical protein